MSRHQCHIYFGSPHPCNRTKKMHSQNLRVFPRSVINLRIFLDVAVAPYRPNLDKNDPHSFYLILSKKLWHHYFGVRICGYQIREVQETQCHKIEKKGMKEKKCTLVSWQPTHRELTGWVCTSPGIPGWATGKGELKTEAPKLHHNTMETMDTTKIAFL